MSSTRYCEPEPELRALPWRGQITYAFGALVSSVDLRRATSPVEVMARRR